MQTVTLPDGTAVPRLGFGTWRMGERAGEASREIAAVRLALDLGMTLIDTAEMYGEGGAEEIVGEALAGRRDEAFVVSKVYPHNGSRDGVVAACERSLTRMQTDRIDLYLLHWPGSHPISETIEGFESLRADGKILRWGVSNFDTDAMAELWSAGGGEACATNQVLYNLARQGVEFDLLPWQRQRGMPTMAYSPLEQGRAFRGSALTDIARRHDTTAMAVALAWVMREGDVIAIPKASDPLHIRANRAAADLMLTGEDLAELDKAFPPPTSKRPLEIL
jgi:diketogulonate reductase-like aldo/keto reductase